jgi:hypothetical protein
LKEQLYGFTQEEIFSKKARAEIRELGEDPLLRFQDVNRISILKDTIITYDLNILNSWLQQPSSAEVNCSVFLDVWNILLDLSDCVKENFYGKTDDTLPVYEKLLYGCNLPSMRENGEYFTAYFSEKEINILSLIIKDSIKIINKYLLFG